MAVEESERPQELEHGYYSESRSLPLSVVSILPLIVVYHVGIVARGYAVRNLAEVWLQGPLGLLGLHAAQVLNLAVIIALGVVLVRGNRSGLPNLLIAVVMVAEAAFYALLLHRSGVVLANAVYDGARDVFFAIHLQSPADLALALGAGVYEELLFRLLMVGGGSLLLQKVFLWSTGRSVAVSLVVSSLLFSAVHHLGPLGEPFDAYVFTYRAVCGLLLGVVYLSRGFGVAVWTHSLYNALVIL
jgi:hypothetical protein